MVHSIHPKTLMMSFMAEIGTKSKVPTERFSELGRWNPRTSSSFSTSFKRMFRGFCNGMAAAISGSGGTQSSP